MCVAGFAFLSETCLFFISGSASGMTQINGCDLFCYMFSFLPMHRGNLA